MNSFYIDIKVRKHLILFLSGSFLLLFVVGSSFAQQDTSLNTPPEEKEVEEVEQDQELKSPPCQGKNTLNTIHDSHVEIHTQQLKAFNEIIKTLTDTKIDLENGGTEIEGLDSNLSNLMSYVADFDNKSTTFQKEVKATAEVICNLDELEVPSKVQSLKDSLEESKVTSGLVTTFLESEIKSMLIKNIKEE